MTSLQAALPGPYYVDQEHWLREREQVLHREWFCAGRLPDLAPGWVAPVDVAGESVLVTCDAAGSLRAFYNVCRHRGSQVVPVDPDGATPEACAAGALRCPYHSWTYDLSGRLLRAPHTEDVDDFDPAAFGLHPVAADTWGGFLFLHLTPEAAPPLRSALGPAVDRVTRYPLESLVVGDSRTYDVRANYKVLLENYNECYHCAGVHPELVRLVPAFGRGGADLDWEDGIPHREGAWTFTASGTTTRAPFAGLDEQERVRHKGELLYPNLMLSLSADHVATFTLWPTAPDRTRIVFDVLVAADERAKSTFDVSDAMDFWDTVNRQDWAVCESVQRGMTSRAYTQGWFAPMEDASLDIRRWLLPRLGEAP
ncbi:MAG TPA: aromatic ring-hydroxylating dioxygenase subunit alpha [Actinomycetes bacterium]|nr:aromatic ring-hydroxylating dioxygenase subunit alpha [Actinomycetes bacterium]